MPAPKPPPDVAEPVYTVQEAAEKLRVKPSWLYRQGELGTIPRHMFGRYVRFTESDLIAIQRQTAEQPITLPRR